MKTNVHITALDYLPSGVEVIAPEVDWDIFPCSDITISQSTFDCLCRDFCDGSLTTGMS